MVQAPDGRLDPALRRLVAVVLLGGIMGILDGSIVAVANHTLAARFGASLTSISWISTGYLLALTVAVPVTTWAVDRFGGKRLWLFGLGLFLLGSVAAGLAWNIGSLIVFRVVQGVGAGTVDPLMPTLLARAAGPGRAGRVMGLMGVVGSSGPVIGPVLGGIILQNLDWRWMFLVNLPIGVAAFLLAVRILPADPGPAQRTRTRLDVTGLALLGPGVAAIVLALSRTADRGRAASWEVLVPLAVGAVLLAGYVIHARRVRRTPPLVDLRMFARRSFTASVTVMALVGLATFASLFILPLYYQQVRGHDAATAGLLLAPLGVGAAISMPLSGRLSDRYGSRGLALAGAVVAALSAVAFTQIGAQTNAAWPALATFTIGVGLGCVGAPTIGSLFRTLPAAQVPQGSSTLYMLNQLGASIGIAVVALIMQTVGRDDAVRGFQTAYWWVTGAIVVMLAAIMFLPPRQVARDVPAPAELAASAADRVHR
jgi:EmrB/QacA subfamily drug resistance transporter